MKPATSKPANLLKLMTSMFAFLAFSLSANAQVIGGFIGEPNTQPNHESDYSPGYQPSPGYPDSGYPEYGRGDESRRERDSRPGRGGRYPDSLNDLRSASGGFNYQVQRSWSVSDQLKRVAGRLNDQVEIFYSCTWNNPRAGICGRELDRVNRHYQATDMALRRETRIERGILHEFQMVGYALNKVNYDFGYRQPGPVPPRPYPPGGSHPPGYVVVPK